MSTTNTDNNVDYTGQNNLGDLLKDYFNPENEDEQYLVIKKKRNETTGLIIHDTANVLFKQEQTNIGTAPNPDPDPTQCEAGKEYSQTYKKCIPICKNNETYDPVKDKCISTTPSTEIPLNIHLANVTASKDDGNIATNIFDGKIETRWSSEGRGEWLDLLFTKEIKLTKIGVAFYKGNTRQTDFTIGGNNLRSNGQTDQIQMFPITSDVIGQKIRIVFQGNNRNLWNSVTEIQTFGQVIGDPNPLPDQHILKSIIFARNIGQGGSTPSNLDSQLSASSTEAKPNDMIILDGTSSTPLDKISNWVIRQPTSDPQKVTLEDVLEGGSVQNLKKKFIFPDTNNILNFELEISDAQNNKDTSTTKVTRKADTEPEPPVENGLVKIHDSNLVLSKEHSVKAGQFSSVDPQIDMTNAGQGDKTLYIKKGTNGQNYITFGGERTRWNVFYSKDYRDANDWNKIPKTFCNIMYEIEWSPLNANCRNLSFSFRTIHDPLSDGKEGFGKFGMHWGISDGKVVGIKVEYFHNKHGKGHDFPLPKAIEIGKKVKTRMWIWSDPTGKREVTQFGQIQYEDDPKWYDVVKFTYNSSNWGSVPTGGSSVDKAEITGGPYMLSGIRTWCRSNGGGQFNIYSFNLYRIETIPKI